MSESKPGVPTPPRRRSERRNQSLGGRAAPVNEVNGSGCLLGIVIGVPAEKRKSETMHYFDHEGVAREGSIPAEKLKELRNLSKGKSLAMT